MKKTYSNSLIKIALFVALLILINCSDDQSSMNEEASLSEIRMAITQSEMDDISVEIDDLIENISSVIETLNVSKNSVQKNVLGDELLSDCVIITTVTTDLIRLVTLDFGDGCTTKNDNFLSGKILMEISRDMDNLIVTVNTTFEEFYFNYRKVEGEVLRFRTKTNDMGYPESTIHKNVTITWEDGSVKSIQGERKREWVEGFDNHIWSDNVFLITGSWLVTNKEGLTRTSTIIEPLKRVTACKFIVKGMVEIQKGDQSVTLNYGDGTCDDKAIVTKNGVDHEIQLRKKRRK